MTEQRCTYVPCSHRKGRTTMGHCTDSTCGNWVNSCPEHKTGRDYQSPQYKNRKRGT